MDSWTPKAEYIDRLGKKPLLRWIAGGAVALAVIVIATSLLLGGGSGSEDALTPAAQAAAAANSATFSAEMVRNAVDVLGDPSSSGVQINEAAVALSEFDSASRDVATAANTLAEQHEGSDVSSTLLIQASEQGAAIERRLGAAFTYRLVFERAFLVPELPDSADISGAADISFELSAMVADTQRALDQLPFDPALEDHRRLAAQALADIEVLSSQYVEALRAEQAGTAARHSATITELAQDAHSALDPTLARLGEQIIDQVGAFEATLDDAATALARLESQ